MLINQCIDIDTEVIILKNQIDISNNYNQLAFASDNQYDLFQDSPHIKNDE